MTLPPRKFGQYLPERERSRHRIELVAALDESRRGRGIEIRPERHHHDVALEWSRVRLHPFGRRIDGADGRLHETQTRLVDRAVGVEDVGGRLLPEHDVQLRESENESVALVDEDDVDVVAELFGESGGELQATEARSEYQDPHRLHTYPLRSAAAALGHGVIRGESIGRILVSQWEVRCAGRRGVGRRGEVMRRRRQRIDAEGRNGGSDSLRWARP